MLVNPSTFTLAGSGNSKIYCNKLEHLTITDGTNVIQYGYCNPYLVVEAKGNFYIKSHNKPVEVTVSSSGGSGDSATISIANGGTGATTLAGAQTALGIVDNSSLLPQKIGSAQKWYQRGLRYSAGYPYPYISSEGQFLSGAQYFMPFTALEDATITTLEINCTTAQANATTHLGIYASDSNNDVAAPLFTSNQIPCSTTGIKIAFCNVQIVKGKVYWLSILSIGALSFNRNSQDSLFPIKGSISASAAAPNGYYTTNNTSMTQSAPTSKLDNYGSLPRVMFVVA